MPPPSVVASCLPRYSFLAPEHSFSLNQTSLHTVIQKKTRYSSCRRITWLYSINDSYSLLPIKNQFKLGLVFFFFWDQGCTWYMQNQIQKPWWPIHFEKQSLWMYFQIKHDIDYKSGKQSHRPKSKSNVPIPGLSCWLLVPWPRLCLCMTRSIEANKMVEVSYIGSSITEPTIGSYMWGYG